MPDLLAFIAGDDDPYTVEAARFRLKTWISHGDGFGVQTVLGFSTLAQARRGLRDRLLVKAARTIPGSQWHRAEVLASAIHAFECRRWPRWRHLHAAPDEATEIDRLLWEARHLGATLPTSVRAIFNII